MKHMLFSGAIIGGSRKLLQLVGPGMWPFREVLRHLGLAEHRDASGEAALVGTLMQFMMRGIYCEAGLLIGQAGHEVRIGAEN